MKGICSTTAHSGRMSTLELCTTCCSRHSSQAQHKQGALHGFALCSVLAEHATDPRALCKGVWATYTCPATECGQAQGAHPLVVPVEELGPLLLLLARLPVLVLCHLLPLLLIPPLLVEPGSIDAFVSQCSMHTLLPNSTAWLYSETMISMPGL